MSIPPPTMHSYHSPIHLTEVLILKALSTYHTPTDKQNLDLKIKMWDIYCQLEVILLFILTVTV